MLVCSSAFTSLGRFQAKALRFSDLPIAVVPHPFGNLTRDQLRGLAAPCAEDIARLACEVPAPTVEGSIDISRAAQIEVPDDTDEINRLFREWRWTDGLPIVPPDSGRLERMLACTPRASGAVIAAIAPGFGAATVERIAINAVMAGCDPEYLPVLIAAAEAVAAPEFNLQAIQTTTNPTGVGMIVNGPIAQRLKMNSGINALGQGNWANATLGRALRLIMQNIGRAWPGDMDRSTLGHPGKYLFCCAENEDESPWEPLHVERGCKREQSAVTVIAVEGSLNMNTYSKDADEMLRLFSDTLPRPTGNDYWHSGNPWIFVSPEHAQVLKAGGLSKADVKRRLWEQSKLRAGRMGVTDLQRTQNRRRLEMGEITPDTMMPICPTPEHFGIIVAGGPGTHSMYIPSYGPVRSVTRIIVSAQ